MNKKTIISTSVFILFVIFVIPILLLSTLNSLSYFDQPSLDVLDDLHMGRKYEQEFIGYKDYLEGFGMSIKNPMLQNKKKIIMEVYKDNLLIRKTEMSGINISDGAFVRFVFPAIEDSMNKKYKVMILTPDSNQNESLYIFLSKKGSVELGESFVDGNKSERKIAMVGYYKVNSKLNLFSYVYKEFIQNFLTDTKFVIFYLIAIILILIKILKSQQ